MRWWMAALVVPEEREDDLAAWIDASASVGAEFRAGAGGTVEARVYFAAEGDPTALERAARRVATGLGGRAAAFQDVADEGWAEEYQRSLLPFPLGERFRVYPGDAPGTAGPGERLPIHLPPGRAFGTGDHATTALCVEYLERAVRPGHHVLDIGTGSGILSIAAVLLGATRVVAIEPDREAAAVAGRNFRRNGVARRIELIAGTTADLRSGWFDVAAANILAGTLVSLLPEISFLLRPGACAVLSGVEAGEEGRVETAAWKCGLQVTGIRPSAGWVAVDLRKPE